MKSGEAFRYCEGLTKSHYENFPIGWFVPKGLRKYVYAVYAFARTADDFSDEPSYEGQRLERLDQFEKKLDQALAGSVASASANGIREDLIFRAVAETIEKTEIPTKLFKDLLTAFRMDVTKKRYRNYAELENYCVYSANPIGRIVLLLFGFNDPGLLALSDRICTGIQLVNHWQDIAVDLSKDRVYLPEEDMRRFHYSFETLAERKVNDAFRALMRFEIARTRSLFYEGRPLLDALERRLRWQISLMWLGPMRILDKIESVDYDVFHSRPTLAKSDLMKLFTSILIKGVS
jgi:squalene synthase HpnC